MQGWTDFCLDSFNHYISKTGFKVLQLTTPALTVLDSLPRTNRWVFPGDSASGHMVNVKDAWGDVLKQAGLSGWRLHDLRHAFASMMVNSGATATTHL
jgi:integrase